MIHYLLDANAVISILNDIDSKVSKRALLHKPQSIGISSIVVHELFYGAFKSKRQKRNVAIVDSLLFQVIDFDKEDARKSGELRAVLAQKGTPIGPYDVLIAGQALSRNLILVTHNSAEFSRVKGLKIEDWN